jgi:hypothetical protein
MLEREVKVKGDVKVWIPREKVKRHLRPHLQEIANCVHEGFDEYFRLPEEQRIKLHARSQASDIRDFIVAAVKRRFDGVAGIQFVERRGMFLLVIDGAACVRFKKLDSHKRSRNIETQQSLQFANGDMAGFLESTACLDAGYILDRFGTAISSAHVVFPKQVGVDSVAYSIDLPYPNARTQPISAMPPRHSAPQTTVRVKKDAAKVVPFKSKSDEKKNG